MPTHVSKSQVLTLIYIFIFYENFRKNFIMLAKRNLNIYLKYWDYLIIRHCLKKLKLNFYSVWAENNCTFIYLSAG